MIPKVATDFLCEGFEALATDLVDLSIAVGPCVQLPAIGPSAQPVPRTQEQTPPELLNEISDLLDILFFWGTIEAPAAT
jgi:hypothetical protein